MQLSCKHVNIITSWSYHEAGLYYPVNSLLFDELIETGPPSYIKQPKCICLHVVPFEQERAHTSVSSYGIEYVHCFEQSQHLLIQVDLIGVVARFGTAKYLCLKE